MIHLCFTEPATTLMREEQHNYSLPWGLSYVARRRCTFCPPSIQKVAVAIAGEWGRAWLGFHEPTDNASEISLGSDGTGGLSPGSAEASGHKGRAQQRWEEARALPGLPVLPRRQPGSTEAIRRRKGRQFPLLRLLLARNWKRFVSNGTPALVWLGPLLDTLTCGSAGRGMELGSPHPPRGGLVAPQAWAAATPQAARSFPDAGHRVGFDL